MKSSPEGKLLLRRDGKRLRIRAHTTAFLTVNLFLVMVNWMTAPQMWNDIDKLWFPYPVGGWGIFFGYHWIMYLLWRRDHKQAIRRAEESFGLKPGQSLPKDHLTRQVREKSSEASGETSGEASAPLPTAAPVKVGGPAVDSGQDYFLTGGKAPTQDPVGWEEGALVAERYKIQRLLGRGGMGEVYLVRDTLRQEEVALKRLNPQLSSLPELRNRFLAELKITEKLTHSGIVRSLGLDQDTTSGSLCYIMEYIEGETLEMHFAQDTPLPVPEMLTILHQLADIQEHAHAMGIIHRDLKPENMILQKDQRLKLLDFGIARVLNQGAAVTSHTTVGLGTAYYMAPEQLQGGEVSRATDLFAMGVIAYRMLTGLLPVGMPRKPSNVVDGLSTGMDDILFRAIAQDPKQRFSSAKELADALATEWPSA